MSYPELNSYDTAIVAPGKWYAGLLETLQRVFLSPGESPGPLRHD